MDRRVELQQFLRERAQKSREEIVKQFAKNILPLVEDFYKNPENEKDFQEWLKKRNKTKQP